jgi:hypothetical protein
MTEETTIEIKMSPINGGIDTVAEYSKVHEAKFNGFIEIMKQRIEKDYEQSVLLKATEESKTNFRVHEIRNDKQPSGFGLIHFDIEGGFLICRFTPISKCAKAVV